MHVSTDPAGRARPPTANPVHTAAIRRLRVVASRRPRSQAEEPEHRDARASHARSSRTSVHEGSSIALPTSGRSPLREPEMVDHDQLHQLAERLRRRDVRASRRRPQLAEHAAAQDLQVVTAHDAASQ